MYSAEQMMMGGEFSTSYAIKVLQPETPKERKAVLDEFSAVARLSHPGLVQFRGAFEVPDGHIKDALCLVMELCEGTLAERLEAGHRLAPEEARGVARDVAEVLAWLHGQKVVHRDLKPANVFRAGDRWKLGGLGLVQPVEGTLDRTEKPRGTPLYRAPETMKNLVGPSVDVWALGVMLQECLTGVLAYSASSEVALVDVMMTQEPTLAPDLPAPFDAVMRGCLVKDPRARWTAEQVLGALEGSSSAPARPSVASRSRSEVVTSAPRGLVALGRNAHGRERFQVEGVGSVLVSLPGWIISNDLAVDHIVRSLTRACHHVGPAGTNDEASGERAVQCHVGGGARAPGSARVGISSSLNC